MDQNILDSEWLEAGGLGGYASGTVGGARPRRYHALLMCATTPPTGRVVLVNGVEAWVETAAGTFAMTSQRYTPNVTHPDGHKRIIGFQFEPWPCWTFQLEDGTHIVQEIISAHERGETLMRWTLDAATAARRETRDDADRRVRLHLRPLLSGRDYHSLHRENSGFRFDARIEGSVVAWQPYDGLPTIVALSNGEYRHTPDWYRNFLYSEEQGRGLDCIEDLGSPGEFAWDLSAGEAILIFRAEPTEREQVSKCVEATEYTRELLRAEGARRALFSHPLNRAADAYIVRRREGKTIVAGYPWFTDWGRDAFIALRGLCLARGELQTAGEILTSWADHVSEGMLPNRFPDGGEIPEYNSVDASLWYVVAVHEYLEAADPNGTLMEPESRKLNAAISAIVEGYALGTRFGIRMDADGLLAAGVPGVQLTWMDAKIGDWVVTPRIGKPVEIQALWLNAVKIAGQSDSKWQSVFERGRCSFLDRFLRSNAASLYDVVDVDHVPGRNDGTFRPNQIFAVGGLPFPLLEDEDAQRLVDAVEAKLLTPLGLRSLAPDEAGYRGRYEGGVWERDSAYHQGTVWPWLIGPFVEAWLRVRAFTPKAKREARRRFLQPLVDHLETAGLGHVSEITDAEPPFTPRGCPFQAWSVGELIRVLAITGQQDLLPASRSRMVKRKRSQRVYKEGRFEQSRDRMGADVRFDAPAS